MTTVITPSTGAGVIFTQGGVGASPGYAAIDARRGDSCMIAQGPIAAGAYLVSQRGAGANMSVDIAANAGYVAVGGTTIGFQGVYLVAPHSAVINETIAAADPTNPRIDQAILQVQDNTIDGSGQSRVTTAILTGTPTPGATLANRSGAAALPASSYRLADILVPAASSSVTNANIKDKRPKQRGKSIISATESHALTSYSLLTTPDIVTELVLPTDGIIYVAYQATWNDTVNSNGRAAIFVGANQLKLANGTSPGVQEAISTTAATDHTLASFTGGLIAGSNAGYAGDVATGQIIGAATGAGTFAGFVPIFAAAGTYDISVQFKNNAAGTVTAKNRKLWVWTVDPALGVLA